MALPPSHVHPNSNAALGTGLRRYDGIETLAAILRCRAGMTGWRAGARPPLPCQYVGLEGPCLSASQCPHQRRWPETRPPQAPPARHSGEGRNPDRRPALNQCALRARLRGQAICGLATVERASKLKRRTGYRPAPVRRNRDAGGYPPLPYQYDGLEGWCPFSVAAPVRRAGRPVPFRISVPAPTPPARSPPTASPAHSSFRRRPESRSALTAALGRGVVNALPLEFHTARRTPQVSPAGCTCGTWS